MSCFVSLQPVAFVVCLPGSTLSPREEAQLRDLTVDLVGPFAVPCAFIQVPELPETISGKYLRRVLREMVNMEEEEASGASMPDFTTALQGDLSSLRNPECLSAIFSAIQQSRLHLRQDPPASTEEDAPSPNTAAVLEALQDMICQIIGADAGALDPGTEVGAEAASSADGEPWLMHLGLDSLQLARFRDHVDSQVLGPKGAESPAYFNQLFGVGALEAQTLSQVARDVALALDYAAETSSLSGLSAPAALPEHRTNAGIILERDRREVEVEVENGQGADADEVKEVQRGRKFSSQLRPIGGLDACFRGDLEAAKALVAAGWEPQRAVCKAGSTPLLWAASGGHVHIMDWLFDTTAPDVNEGNDVGRTALMFAVKYRHIVAAQWLMAKGADVRAASKDGSPVFHWAIFGGDLAIMNWLSGLDGVDLHASNNFGCTAVHWAAAKGDVSVMRWLFDHGVDFTIVNEAQHDALNKAAWKGKSDALQWLMYDEDGPKLKLTRTDDFPDIDLPPPPGDQADGTEDETEPTLSFGKDDICAICLDTMRNPIRLPACGHWYCKECIEGLRRTISTQDSCPVCRVPLPPGPGQFFDEAYKKSRSVERQVERLDQGWSNLPQELQQEMDEVRELYKKAADGGLGEGMVNLGIIHMRGQGVEVDFSKAKEYFEAAAEKGVAEAMGNLAVFHAMGHGIPVDPLKAAEWYQLAADKGCAQAQYHVGAIYESGEVYEQDFTKAREWYDLSVEQGHPGAMMHIGTMYRDGKGEPQDFMKAIEWYEMAAEHGHPGAMSHLGLIYLCGQGVDPDFAKAKEWFELAVSLGHAGAMGNIGTMYANGMGFDQDFDEAMRWFMEAKAHGYDTSAQVEWVTGKKKEKEDFNAMWDATLQINGSAVKFQYADFGPLSPFSGSAVMAVPELADSELTNAQELSGAVAVVKRGNSDPTQGGTACHEKARRAQDAGALAVIVVNDDEIIRIGDPDYEAEDIAIPVLSVENSVDWGELNEGIEVSLVPKGKHSSELSEA